MSEVKGPFFNPDVEIDGEPLGLKEPLLPPKRLGIIQRFLVPLGARTLSILDPSIFQLDELQDDALGSLAQTATAFQELDTSIPENTQGGQIQRSKAEKLSVQPVQQTRSPETQSLLNAPSPSDSPPPVVSPAEEQQMVPEPMAIAEPPIVQPKANASPQADTMRAGESIQRQVENITHLENLKAETSQSLDLQYTDLHKESESGLQQQILQSQTDNTTDNTSIDETHHHVQRQSKIYIPINQDFSTSTNDRSLHRGEPPIVVPESPLISPLTEIAEVNLSTNEAQIAQARQLEPPNRSLTDSERGTSVRGEQNQLQSEMPLQRSFVSKNQETDPIVQASFEELKQITDTSSEPNSPSDDISQVETVHPVQSNQESQEYQENQADLDELAATPTISNLPIQAEAIGEIQDTIEEIPVKQTVLQSSYEDVASRAIEVSVRDELAKESVVKESVPSDLMTSRHAKANLTNESQLAEAESAESFSKKSPSGSEVIPAESPLPNPPLAKGRELNPDLTLPPSTLTQSGNPHTIAVPPSPMPISRLRQGQGEGLGVRSAKQITPSSESSKSFFSKTIQLFSKVASALPVASKKTQDQPDNIQHPPESSNTEEQSVESYLQLEDTASYPIPQEGVEDLTQTNIVQRTEEWAQPTSQEPQFFSATDPLPAELQPLKPSIETESFPQEQSSKFESILQRSPQLETGSLQAELPIQLSEQDLFTQEQPSSATENIAQELTHEELLSAELFSQSLPQVEEQSPEKKAIIQPFRQFDGQSIEIDAPSQQSLRDNIVQMEARSLNTQLPVQLVGQDDTSQDKKDIDVKYLSVLEHTSQDSIQSETQLPETTEPGELLYQTEWQSSETVEASNQQSSQPTNQNIQTDFPIQQSNQFDEESLVEKLSSSTMQDGSSQTSVQRLDLVSRAIAPGQEYSPEIDALNDQPPSPLPRSSDTEFPNIESTSQNTVPSQTASSNPSLSATASSTDHVVQRSELPEGHPIKPDPSLHSTSTSETSSNKRDDSLQPFIQNNTESQYFETLQQGSSLGEELNLPAETIVQGDEQLQQIDLQSQQDDKVNVRSLKPEVQTQAAPTSPGISSPPDILPDRLETSTVGSLEIEDTSIQRSEEVDHPLLEVNTSTDRSIASNNISETQSQSTALSTHRSISSTEDLFTPPSITQPSIQPEPQSELESESRSLSAEEQIQSSNLVVEDQNQGSEALLEQSTQIEIGSLQPNAPFQLLDQDETETLGLDAPIQRSAQPEEPSQASLIPTQDISQTQNAASPSSSMLQVETRSPELDLQTQAVGDAEGSLSELETPITLLHSSSIQQETKSVEANLGDTPSSIEESAQTDKVQQDTESLNEQFLSDKRSLEVDTSVQRSGQVDIPVSQQQTLSNQISQPKIPSQNTATSPQESHVIKEPWQDANLSFTPSLQTEVPRLPQILQNLSIFSPLIQTDPQDPFNESMDGFDVNHLDSPLLNRSADAHGGSPPLTKGRELNPDLAIPPSALTQSNSLHAITVPPSPMPIGRLRQGQGEDLGVRSAMQDNTFQAASQKHPTPEQRLTHLQRSPADSEQQLSPLSSSIPESSLDSAIVTVSPPTAYTKVAIPPQKPKPATIQPQSAHTVYSANSTSAEATLQRQTNQQSLVSQRFYHQPPSIQTVRTKGTTLQENLENNPSDTVDNASDLEQDLETLAQMIYEDIQQRLKVDRERHGHSFGRLPW